MKVFWLQSKMIWRTDDHENFVHLLTRRIPPPVESNLSITQQTQVVLQHFFKLCFFRNSIRNVLTGCILDEKIRLAEILCIFILAFRIPCFFLYAKEECWLPFSGLEVTYKRTKKIYFLKDFTKKSSQYETARPFSRQSNCNLFLLLFSA